MAVAREAFPEGAIPGTRGPVVIATPQGDVHDLGKTSLGWVLTTKGFRVVDCGKDCPVADMVAAATREQAFAVLAAAHQSRCSAGAPAARTAARAWPFQCSSRGWRSCPQAVHSGGVERRLRCSRCLRLRPLPGRATSMTGLENPWRRFIQPQRQGSVIPQIFGHARESGGASRCYLRTLRFWPSARLQLWSATATMSLRPVGRQRRNRKRLALAAFTQGRLPVVRHFAIRTPGARRRA